METARYPESSVRGDSPFASAIGRLRSMREDKTWLRMVPDSAVTERAERVAITRSVIKGKLVCDHSKPSSSSEIPPARFSIDLLWLLVGPFLILVGTALLTWLLWNLLHI